MDICSQKMEPSERLMFKQVSKKVLKRQKLAKALACYAQPSLYLDTECVNSS